MSMEACLLSSAIRSLILAGITGSAFAVFRVRHPAVRKVAWAAVLAVSFVMPFLNGHLLQINRLNARELVASLPSSVSMQQPAAPVPVQRTDARSRSLLEEAALLLYACICAAFLVRIGFGLYAATRLWRAAQPAYGLGPSVRFSAEAKSPWTFGSRILLPETAKGWGDEKLEIVLAHERSHVRCGDFYLQLAARVYTALFWFSPLGWWLQKECICLSEQTSDYAALSMIANPVDYAEMLVEFSTASTPSTVVGMARLSGLQGRLQLILSKGELMHRFSAPLRSVVITALALPLSLTAATLSLNAQARPASPERLAGTVNAADQSGVDGFACTLEDGTPVVGIRSTAGVRVSVGTLTSQRVSAIKAVAGDLFLAFHSDGRDYVITDPSLVREALGYFAANAPMAPPSKTANRLLPPTTAREAAQQKQIDELTAQLASLQARKAPATALISPVPKDAVERLAALIVHARQNGQAHSVTI